MKKSVIIVQVSLCSLLMSCNQMDVSERAILTPPIDGPDSLLVKQFIDTGLPVVWIKTVDDEEPLYEDADAPEGCLGGSIRNATKVPGRIVVQDGNGIIYDSGKYVAKRSGMTINVRGNWSARRPKKPFKIKLQTLATT